MKTQTIVIIVLVLILLYYFYRWITSKEVVIASRLVAEIQVNTAEISDQSDFKQVK